MVQYDKQKAINTVVGISMMLVEKRDYRNRLLQGTVNVPDPSRVLSTLNEQIQILENQIWEIMIVDYDTDTDYETEESCDTTESYDSS